VTVNGKKMSKSANNFYTKKDLEEKFNDPKFYVSQNYQEDLNSYEEVKNQLHEVTEKWIYLSEQIGSISKQES